MPEPNLVIVGGTLFEAWEEGARTDSCPDTTVFVGQAPNLSDHQLFDFTRLVLVGSWARREGLSRLFLDLIACGMPALNILDALIANGVPMDDALRMMAFNGYMCSPLGEEATKPPPPVE